MGRYFTVQFAGAGRCFKRHQQTRRARGLRGMRNQTAIDMLEAGDVAVVDLYGKIGGGTFVGDKLAYYVQKDRNRTHRGRGLFYLNRLAATGMPAYYQGTHLVRSNAMLTGINIPVRIGEATVMPGDIVLGDRDGVLFIPPQMANAILDSVVTAGAGRVGEAEVRHREVQVRGDLRRRGTELKKSSTSSSSSGGPSQ